MAYFKSIEEVWSPKYKQEIIEYVIKLEKEKRALEEELKKATNGSYGKGRSEKGTYKSKNGCSKAQNVKLCYNLYYTDQKSKAQIARQLGVSESTVTRYLTLAREEKAARSGAYSPQAREVARKKREQERKQREDELRRMTM